jgi:hypothetical protein
MDLTMADVLQPVLAGLGGLLGVYAVQDLLQVLDRRGVSLPWRR